MIRSVIKDIVSSVVHDFGGGGAAKPKAPTNLTALILSATSVRLSWSAASNNYTGYILERSQDGINYIEVATIANINTLTYDDTITTGAYYYQVRAYNIDSYSGYSNAQYIDTTLVVGLLNYYDYDELSGNLIDKWGDIDGILSGPTQGVVGKLGKAYSFITDDFILLNNTHTFQTSDSFTFDFWIKPAFVSGSAINFQIFDRSVNINSIISVWYTSGTGGADLNFRIRGSNGAGLTTVTIAKAFTIADVWYHVLCERNVSSDNINIWVNGIAGTPVTDATTSAIGPFTLKIASTQAGGAYLNALLDDMHIWNKALSSTEKALLYNSGKGNLFLSPINYNGQGLSTAFIPTDVSATWIEDYMTIEFTDNSSGIAQHEIWISNDGGSYYLIATLGIGVTSYDYKRCWQNSSTNIKVRAKIDSFTSADSVVFNILTPLTLKVTVTAEDLTVNITNLYMTSGHTIRLNWGDGEYTDTSAASTTPQAHTYSSAGVYWFTLTGEGVPYIQFFEWYNEAAHLAGTYVDRWILPTNFQFGHLYNNGFLGDMTNQNLPSETRGFHLGGNQITADITNWIFPSQYWDIHIYADALSKITGDISNWVLPQNIAHFNIYGYVSGNLTAVIPFQDTTYGGILLQLQSSHPVGFYGDLSNWILPDKPGTLVATGGCHFTKLPRGNFRYITIFNFSANNCDQTEIDNFLAFLDDYYTGGVVPAANCSFTLNGTGMGVPSSIGLAHRQSIIDKYITAGFTGTILVNS